jgi:hypothetical protein
MLLNRCLKAGARATQTGHKALQQARRDELQSQCISIPQTARLCKRQTLSDSTLKIHNSRMIPTTTANWVRATPDRPFMSSKSSSQTRLIGIPVDSKQSSARMPTHAHQTLLCHGMHCATSGTEANKKHTVVLHTLCALMHSPLRKLRYSTICMPLWHSTLPAGYGAYLSQSNTQYADFHLTGEAPPCSPKRTAF